VAYEVTLVQLTPTTPANLGGGIVQQTGLDIQQISAPRLVSVGPQSGPLAMQVGTQAVAETIALAGFGFAPKDQSVQVTVGGVSVAISGTAADRSLSVTLPTRPGAGPDLDVIVALGRLRSRPLTFTATPWLSSSTPIRTALDPGVSQALNVVLSGRGIQAAADVKIFGPRGILTAATSAGPGAHEVTAKLPPAGTTNATAAASRLINGNYTMRARLADNSLSNPRDLEVIPLLTSAAFDLPSKTLTLNGARLDGSDVHLLFDAADYSLGPQTTGSKLSFVFKRTPASGAHLASVIVDGHGSHDINLTV
jgi:hypothetical protein